MVWLAAGIDGIGDSKFDVGASTRSTLGEVAGECEILQHYNSSKCFVDFGSNKGFPRQMAMPIVTGPQFYAVGWSQKLESSILNSLFFFARLGFGLRWPEFG